MNDVYASQQLDDILAFVATKINADAKSLSEDSDLFAAGLDSITLMGLVAHWRTLGHPVDFATLARAPRASAWARYLSAPLMQHAVTSSSIEQLTKTKPTKLDAPFPLAPMQYAYWLGRDPKQPLGGVSAHLYTEFQRANAQLDPERLAQALTRLNERHASLRLKVTTDGQQEYLPIAQATALQINDWRHETEQFVNNQLEECRETFSSQILNIEAGEVLAIALSLLPDGSSRLHLDVDMMAADAVSYRTLLRELALLYEDIHLELPPLSATYRDYRLASEKRWPSVKEGAGQWWQNRLYTLPEGPQLPLKPLSGTPQTTRRHFHFDASLRDALYAQSRQHGLTPASVLASVLAETLAGWSREPRFLLNVPLFLRPMDGADMSGVVGDFSSSIMLEADMTGRTPFVERARQIQARLHEDAAHADYNGVQVLRDLGRLKGRQITAPVVFTSALNLGELFDPAVRRVFGDPIWIISQGPQVLLDTQITELDGGLLLNWDCRDDAFVDGVLDAMFEFFQQSILSLAKVSDTWSRCLADALPRDRVRPDVVVGTVFDSKVAANQQAAAPKTPIEKAVAAIWRGVIGGEGNNIHQNLFAAGGDSVIASLLVAQLREVFGVDAINMQRLFVEPTVAGLADAIATSGDTERTTQIATIYCEILELDDDALMAEVEGATAS
jgi:mycobactin phenyloxazoline synthetase